MLTKSITHNGREYLCTSAASAAAYVSTESLRLHAKRGTIPHIVFGGRRWYNLDDIRAYFAKSPKTPRKPVYKQDDVTIDGRLYHPLRWYEERYRVEWVQLMQLPVRDLGTRMRYIAEEDFNRSKWAERRRENAYNHKQTDPRRSADSGRRGSVGTGAGADQVLPRDSRNQPFAGDAVGGAGGHPRGNRGYQRCGGGAAAQARHQLRRYRRCRGGED